MSSKTNFIQNDLTLLLAKVNLRSKGQSNLAVKQMSVSDIQPILQEQPSSIRGYVLEGQPRSDVYL